ncbi:ribonuclease D [Bartonella sp. HY038]|uniref:ribonuclease D n=1 Tax=Bartonella sp. HY038 TaxID=2759660 RepID=UPI0015FE661A|nr:ribonuclease D [Bartonella sp. HY038]
MHSITTTKDLEAAIAALSKSDFVTVDTEFLRESTFWPQLCLIQLASPDLEVLIDPLATGIDLSAFFELMGNKKVLKVFHAARQDVEIVYHLGNLIPMPIFDTQIAAMVLGFGDSISYDHLVQKTTGKQLDKSSRFTDWSRRPLSESQLTYALADVTYLRDVYLDLVRQLKKSGRTNWLDEEMQILTSPKTYEYLPENAWARIKGRFKKPREVAVLQKIAAWREREAQKRDLPRGRIVKDDALVEIAIQQPQTMDALSRLRALPKGFERSHFANDLLAAIKEAMALPKEQLPIVKPPKNLPEGANSAIDILKLLLKIISEENNVAAKIIASSDDIEKIVVDGVAAKIGAMHGWRYEMFGKKALQMLEGSLAISFENNRIKLIETVK